MKFSPSVIISDIKTFFPMVFAIFRGKYKMPWGTLIWAIVCFIYLVSPVDALPDVLPLLGITDDAAFVLWIYTKLHQDLARYRALQNGENPDIIEAEIVSTDEEKNKGINK
ncbi:YkvA family protein [Candidatus Avelusimicrobium luingense]|uniref:YkvA family protein n=1 Tax=Candidatus Avelusimicrobium luingense TaxID=3416211 RepID=UPI003D12993A